ncbi:hypothetical protein B0H10DRAFT_1963550 [Mycena sp. CBHHK59/15]|nr:hypothetical protein B0H10DRAFT_1963550 [Mycena sp. CBHHK59/15]
MSTRATSRCAASERLQLEFGVCNWSMASGSDLSGRGRDLQLQPVGVIVIRETRAHHLWTGRDGETETHTASMGTCQRPAAARVMALGWNGRKGSGNELTGRSRATPPVTWAGRTTTGGSGGNRAREKHQGTELALALALPRAGSMRRRWGVPLGRGAELA